MNRKGFTLIELIAVILILAIITLIAIPTVTNIVTTAQKESFEVTCENVYKSLERYKQYEEMKGNSISCMKVEFHSDREEAEIIDGIKYVPAKKLDIKGKLPTYGIGTICNDKIELTADNEKYTCVVNDKGNQVLEGALADNDVTAPVIKSVSLTSTRETITIVVNAEDNDGLIVKYYYKIGEETYESENSYYTIEELEIGTNYEVEVVVENKSGLKSEEYKESIKTKTLVDLEIEETAKDPSVGYEYAKSRTYKIYLPEEVEGIEYYFKSDVEVTVPEGVVTNKCGTGTMPEVCETSSDTTLEINTWYKSSVEPNITYTENGELYALIGKGEEYTSLVTYQVVKIDNENPNISVSLEGKTGTITLSDNLGLTGYGVNNSDSEEPEWIELTSKEATIPWEATAGGSYVAWVKDASGRTNKFTFEIDTSLFCAYELGKIWTFSYKGSPETFIVPCDGTYKLEAYGGKGGHASYNYATSGTCAGSGTTEQEKANGSASGNFKLVKNKELYIYVGGSGGAGKSTDTDCSWMGTATGSGGYNGGVAGIDDSAGSGGATHISLTTGLYSATLLNSGNMLVSANGGPGYWQGYGTYKILKVYGGGSNYVNQTSTYYVDSASTTAATTTAASTAKITLISIGN